MKAARTWESGTADRWNVRRKNSRTEQYSWEPIEFKITRLFVT
jgi:hypothetical protein